MLPLSAACGQHRNSLSCLPQHHTPLTISSDTADNLLADCKNLGHYVFAAWREKGCHRQVLLAAAALDLKTRRTEKKRLLPRHQVRDSPALTEAAGSKGLVCHSSKGPDSPLRLPALQSQGKPCWLCWSQTQQAWGKVPFLLQLWVCILFSLPWCPGGGCWLH